MDLKWSIGQDMGPTISKSILRSHTFFESGEQNSMVHPIERRRDVEQIDGNSRSRIDGYDVVEYFEKCHLCAVLVPDCILGIASHFKRETETKRDRQTKTETATEKETETEIKRDSEIEIEKRERERGRE